MKKLLFLLLIFNVQAEQFIFEARNPDSRQYGKVKCQMLCFGDHDLAAKIATIIKHDLEFTDQLQVDINKSTKPPLTTRLAPPCTAFCAQ